jgi:hypothetical protein
MLRKQCQRSKKNQEEKKQKADACQDIYPKRFGSEKFEHAVYSLFKKIDPVFWP